MPSRSVFPALALLAVLSGPSVHAQVHRCVDDQGKITFSDTVCNGTRAQKTFGVNASAKAWQVEDYRPLRVAQNGAGSSATTSGRPAAVGTPAR